MKFFHSGFLPLLFTSALGLAFAQSATAATTLTFDGASDAPLNLNGGGATVIPNTFGDFAAVTSQGLTTSMGSAVNGTPNIDITWNAAGVTDLYNSWDGRGTVAQLDFGDTGLKGNNILWTFTPNATNAVRITSFDLDLWNGGGNTRVDWAVSGPQSGTLASATWLRNNTGGRDPFVANATGLPGEVLTLSFTRVSGTGSYVGLDNLVIDQIPVPEPTGVALGLLGLAAAGLRRRRTA